MYPFGIYYGKKAVGFIMIAYDCPWATKYYGLPEKYYYIWRFMIDKKYQGQGFGSLIMDKLEKEIFASYDYCELDASLPACIFYENRGFKTVKHIKYDIGDGAFMIYEIMRKMR